MSYADMTAEQLADLRAEANQLVDAEAVERQRGLYGKYDVQRRDDPKGRHADCWYFVLDPKHDKHSRVALAAYAEAVRDEYPALANDLRRVIERPWERPDAN